MCEATLTGVADVSRCVGGGGAGGTNSPQPPEADEQFSSERRAVSLRSLPHQRESG